ncbi:hypothetical protein ATANTOWER_000906 [Ataeniobius toweri]|uniref:Uncharacterized protein n=1 Tax=Ataeniobius toweri TaxID=208326 RepID=A0ABU7C1X0_9TELE|nr:hypothetical protein [Ataeniobius toweri]
MRRSSNLPPDSSVEVCTSFLSVSLDRRPDPSQGWRDELWTWLRTSVTASPSRDCSDSSYPQQMSHQQCV